MQSARINAEIADRVRSKVAEGVAKIESSGKIREQIEAAAKVKVLPLHSFGHIFSSPCLLPSHVLLIALSCKLMANPTLKMHVGGQYEGSMGGVSKHNCVHSDARVFMCAFRSRKPLGNRRPE
jgi:hypothetical protein